MRKPVIVGNWKMYVGSVEPATALAQGVVAACAGQDGVEVGVCPPATALPAVVAACKGSAVGVGGQNLYPKEEGAFTGEISGAFLASLGCRYVILGHSERRTYFQEDDAFINAKVKCALSFGLTPILCCGETQEQRDSGQTESVVDTQLRGGLASLTPEEMSKLIVAYEPVWAIGTGKVATSADAQSVHAFIRGLLTSVSDESTAASIRIQYGGSVKADNAVELLGQPDIDGALVGGASLKADQFGAIIAAAG